MGFSLLSELENLQILENCAHFEDINDESMVSIVCKCQQLQELVLTLNNKITDRSMALIPQYLPKLRKIGAIGSKVSLVYFQSFNQLFNY